MDFDYFTSVVRSEDEAKLDGPEYTPSRRRLLGGGHLLNIVYFLYIKMSACLFVCMYGTYTNSHF